MDNKTLVAKLASRLGKSRADVANLLEGFSQLLAACAAELDSVAIPGFGNFEPIKHNEYVAHDSTTGKRVLNPPRVEINFNPGTVLKKKINTIDEK